MPRELELRATFAGWKLPNGKVMLGPFEIILIGMAKGRSWRYHALLAPSRLPFHDHRGSALSFAESKLEEGKAQISEMFEKQLTDWK